MILLLAQKGGACFSKGKQGDSTPGTRPHKRGLMQLGHKATNTWSSYFGVLVLVNPYNNNKKALVPKFGVGYGSLIDYIGLATLIIFVRFILFEVILSVTSLIDMSFFYYFYQCYFWLSTTYFCSST